MKGYLLLAVTLSISISSHAAIDIYPNPNLTDPSLATTFASQLRNMKIKEMEQVIAGECNQFKEYAYLSIQNWKSFKNQTKSFDEAQQYSQKLVYEIPYRLSSQYTFPLGVRIYSVTEELIKQTTLNDNKLNEFEFLDQMYNACFAMNNTKYFELLSSTKYLSGNQTPFISKDEALKKFDPSNSLFKTISAVPSKDDKLTPPNMRKVINFTTPELSIANTCIDEDIRNSFINSDIRWIDYKKISREMQKSFITFMNEGGKNKHFAQIASLTKIMSPQITGNNDNYIPNRISLTSKLDKLLEKDDPILQKKLSDILKKFNY